VCPKVENLPVGYAEFITKRITAIAAAVGAPVSESCRRDGLHAMNPDEIWSLQKSEIADTMRNEIRAK
jgi:hypothetical protein